jgi:hypothetical protein
LAKGTNTTALVPFELPAMPADVAAFFDAEANVKPRQTVPSLSPGGRKWTLSVNGEDTVLQRKDPKTGDTSPVQIMRVVVLDWNPQRGRAYYSGGYDPDKPGVPVCWSDNGIKPHDRVTDKQDAGKGCAACPQAQKNSKVSENGKGVRACSEHRMLALVPSSKLDFDILRMKISITSDWDAKSPQHEAEGWYGWSNYMDVLRARMPNQTHTARVVTKMKFDDAVDYPKVLFGFDRPTNPEELAKLMVRIRDEKDRIKDLITGTFSPDGRNGVRTDDDDKTETKEPAPPDQPKPQSGSANGAASSTEPTQEAKAAKIAAAKAAPAAAEAKDKAPVETPKQKAIREAKEALAAAEAEEGEGEDEGEGEGEGGDEVELPAAAATAPAVTDGKKSGKGKSVNPVGPAAAAPPSGGDPLGNLLTDWDG